MGSKVIAILAVVLTAIVLALDVTQHGHFSSERIRRSVENNVASEPGAPTLTDLKVNVRERTVHVAGLVDTPEERRRVTEAALRSRGILTLVNDLRVDLLLEQLLVRLRELLASDPTPGEFDYRVGKDGHTVTLVGWVPEDQDEMRSAIERLVRDVPGVRHVINNLTLGPPDDIDRLVRERILDILRLKNIYFDYNKWSIREDSLESIDRIAGVLLEYPTVRMRLEGHTDGIASQEYNQRLSERRAESVKAALVERGVAASRLETIGFGKLRPIAPNDTPEGRADNRRIEFNVIRSGDNPPGATR